jgi:hypothetical protein
MNQSASKTLVPRTNISGISGEHVGKTIVLRARVHNSRPTGTLIIYSGAKMLFVTLRQKTVTVQSILTVDDTKISKQMLKFASGFFLKSHLGYQLNLLCLLKRLLPNPLN